LLYNWRGVTAQVEAWEQNPRNIMRGISDFVNVPVAAPRAVTGTIIVPDESGNGNTLTLETLETYGQEPAGEFNVSAPADGQRARCAFASDPFFETGGGVPGGA